MSKENEIRGKFTIIFTAPPFPTAKKWTAKGPATGEWLKKIWSVFKGILYFCH